MTPEQAELQRAWRAFLCAYMIEIEPLWGALERFARDHAERCERIARRFTR